MSDNKFTFQHDSDSALVWVIGLWVILFYGEPNLMDAIIHWLMK